MAIMETIAKEITTKEVSLKLSLEDALISKKELKGDVLYLKDDLVVTFGTYFDMRKSICPSSILNWT